MLTKSFKIPAALECRLDQVDSQCDKLASNSRKFVPPTTVLFITISVYHYWAEITVDLCCSETPEFKTKFQRRVLSNS